MSSAIEFTLLQIAVIGFLGWIAWRAISSGEIPIPFAGRIYHLSREEMPLAFWFCIALLGLFGLIALLVLLFALLYGKHGA